MQALILLNGELICGNSLKKHIYQNALVLATDGGARHASKLGLKINCLLGDFDSIDAALLKELEQEKVKIIKYPSEKDATDLELALRYAKNQGAREVHLYGIEGGLNDHLIGVLTVFGNAEFFDFKLWGYYGQQRVTRVLSKEQIRFALAAGSRFSLIPLSPEVSGVTLAGAKWELHNATLKFGEGRGLGNIARTTEVVLEVSQGVLMVCMES